MPLYYRGEGIGKHYHVNDARVTGFACRAPVAAHGQNNIQMHIARGTTFSPYISLTRSYGVAWHYAMFTGVNQAQANAANPAYVYEIDIPDPPPAGLVLYDPVKEIANAVPGPLAALSYQHDGVPSFLLGVIDPVNMALVLQAPAIRRPPGGGVVQPANATIELQTFTFALRDAELLAFGNIPANLVVNRFSVP